jgi:hypothetical protein
MELRLDSLEAVFRGESRLGELQQAVAPGISDLYYSAMDGLDKQYSPPTGTQTRCLERVELQLPRFKDALDRWALDLKPFYERLVELGMDAALPLIPE